ncbi:hypothetical protein [Pseudomonas syringae group genomosp. 3]|uniref:hypothetical protein n=1 Tax=Pseudomonas syringae group genomosp. 3 TaxID=251701 RepID=UPI000EFDDC01|nr:hypothetical protein [Pseudomonas syringae group genomosp. 3]
MQKLQVLTAHGWAFVLCFVGKRIETTDDRAKALPRNCPDLADSILAEFEEDFPDQQFRLS